MQTVLISIPLPEFVSQLETTFRKILSENEIPQDKILTSDEVMKLLNISTTTLQHWRDKNKIPFTRLGNKIFYNKAEILKALK